MEVQFGTETRTEAVVSYPDPIGPDEGDPQTNPFYGMDPEEVKKQQAEAREFAEKNPDVYTIYTARVADAWKGTVRAGEQIEVMQLGGTHDGVTHVVVDQESYEPGGSYVLILRTYPRSGGVPASALNPYQGVYPLEDGDRLRSLQFNDIEVTLADLEQLAARK